MKQFEVTIVGTVTVIRSVYVDAEDEENARSEALQNAEATADSMHDWEMVGNVEGLSITEVNEG